MFRVLFAAAIAATASAPVLASGFKECAQDAARVEVDAQIMIRDMNRIVYDAVAKKPSGSDMPDVVQSMIDTRDAAKKVTDAFVKVTEAYCKQLD